MHELFEHTADLGLRIRAADLNTLFAEAGECLLSSMLDNPDAVRPVQSVTFNIPGTDRDFLLFDWLRLLLNYAEDQRFLCCKYELNVTDSGLSGTAWGEPIDPTRHLLSREVKAITYHELKVVRDRDAWLAEVIVDI